MKKQSLFFVPGIILIGVSLRTPFTVLPIILGNISQGLEVEVSSLGVLTSLPLLMFTLFSPFSTQLAQKIGLEHLFTYSLFFLTIGSLIRLINLPLLYLGTLMVGASVAVINVLLPSLIQANQPKKIGFLTTLYVTSMGIATALASYLAVPITQASSWKGLILLLTLLCLATFLVWLPNHRYNHRLAPQTKQKSQIKVMRNKQVWAIIIFSGFQSLIFYTVMTWLPTMSIHAGLSSHEAGLLTSILSLISIPFSMTIPSLTTSLSTRNRQLMLTLVSLAGVVGISMLFFPINNFIYWLAIHLLIGTATSALFPYLMVNFSLKTSAPEKTAQLSGLSQTGGYILAAFGPTLFGYSFDLFHSWVPSVAALLLIDILMTVALFTVDRADKIL
ncbi:TPA: CynX/NimT family MFS transporter [Streptococcus pneumoniae]|jgi:Cyanate permease|uniref:Transporter n=2 Tax=Streptococcus pneumoniae TaxID=1313 RepID=A0A0H2UMY2_STRPN|nr:CynX/NimT family MFS transporter [Streptococcus pneumoniae]EDK64121.1 transporter, putative [Streptococcus pneumoniae SP11-BS70]EDK78357.1 transporter, putative [Streptococcus pneumoniae SP9-BS68]EDT90531.1 cyanate permease [Streptococcus pneumoniae CDC1087-00]EGE88849.1 major Facilitator Superfamily protein [Streptococcus pneumoniae GA04375]EGJ16092.1 major Facilitator Superfamily protein [Streptococcus pneumoniae GA41317]EHD38037.1 major Facilitator Superfamily protein [Streptococcus pne